MNIGIDARLLEKKMTGIGRFLQSILNELSKIDFENNYILYSYTDLSYYKKYYQNVATGKSKLPEKIYSIYWLNFILPKYLSRDKIEIFFSINQVVPFTNTDNIKFISVIHDVFHKIDTSFHSFWYRKYLDFFLQIAIKKSNIVITVSNNSKKDIITHYNVPPDKVRVIYEAAATEFLPIILSDTEKKEFLLEYGLTQKLVLYVGVVESRKNILGILRVADEIDKIDKEIKFLIVGRPGYGSEKILKEIKKRENVIYLSYVDDSALKKIYNLSTLFFFPSFYEGFGLPPLEAMQSGLPVLSARTSALIEVIGSGGIMHEPKDYNSFVNDVLKLFNDPEYYNAWRQKALMRAKAFSFKKTTKEIVEAINSLNPTKL